ncbi:PKD domain-containing protein [bacterium]|nr:PKD domain-containing protein [bacterium]
MFGFIANGWRQNAWHKLPLAIAVTAIVLSGCGGGSTSTTTLPTGPPEMAQLQELLAAELLQLGIDPARHTATAPSGEANAVFNLRGAIATGDPPILTFSWTERMLGDYNQDGLVSVNDLTPIGQRYNSHVVYDDPAGHDGLAWFPTGDPDGDGAANWRAARVDGNGDGLIYLSDITTIAQHWQERLDGYRLYMLAPGATEYALVPNPADAESPFTVPRSAADPEDVNRPFHYSVPLSPATEEGVYSFYVAPYDAAQSHEGTPSNIITLPEGTPPTAALAADFTTGLAPLTVNFDASGSSDADGPLTNFSWDFDGDGTYDEDTAEPYADHTYNDGGTFMATVLVRDAQFMSDDASLEINVAGNQAPTAVITVTPPEPTVVPFLVTFSAAASTDPDGVIAQYDWDWDADGDYDAIDAGPDPAYSNYVSLPGTYSVGLRVSDDQGASDETTVDYIGRYGVWTTFTVDYTTGRGTDLSLEVVDGYPAISYYDGEDQCLRYIRAEDELGIYDWGDSLQLTTGAGIEGYYTSLAVIDGRPAIAYLDVAHDDIRYLRANDAQGSSWPASAVEAHPDQGYYITLVEADGRPAIAFQTLDSNIYYRRADDATGAGWTGLPRQVETYTDNCSMPSMDIVNGSPAIAFTRYMSEKSILCYVHASDPAGADPWNEPVGAASDLINDAGVLPSLAEINGNPGISFSTGDYGSFVFNPYFIRSASATGGAGSWNPIGPKQLASGAYANSFPTSLTQIGAYPHVVYYERDSHTLWHVWGTDYVGDTWMEAEIIDDGGGTNNFVGQYCDVEEVNGRPAVAYWDATADRLKYAVLR